MGAKVTVLIDSNRFSLLQKPGKVVPEIGSMADSPCYHMAHFMNGYKSDNVFCYEGFVAALALSETKEDGFAFIDGIACELCVGCGLCEAICLCLKVAGQLLHLGLVWKPGLKMEFELVHLEPYFGHHVCCGLLIGHIADFIDLAVDAAFDWDEGKLSRADADEFEGICKTAFQLVHPT